MAKTKECDKIIQKMTNNINKNVKIIKKNLSENDYRDLFDWIFIASNFEDYTYKRILALEALLECGFDPNTNCFDDDYPNFVFRVIKNFKSAEQLIMIIINLAIKYKVDLNTVDSKNNTILHNLILFHKEIDLAPFFELLVENGYDMFVTNSSYEDLPLFYKTEKVDLNDKIYINFINSYNKKREELYKSKYNEIINSLPKDKDGRISNEIYNNRNVLSYFVRKNYDEEMTLDILKYLFENGYNPNDIVNSWNQNLVFDAVNSRYHSIAFILKLLELSIKYGLDINHQDTGGNTILHCYIKSGKFNEIIPISDFLIKNGFDYKITNNKEGTIIDLMKDSCYFKDKEKFLSKFSDYYITSFYKKNPELKGLGEIIECYDFERSKYLKNDINFKKRRLVFLTGNDGIGKTETLKHLGKYLSSENYKVFMSSADKIIDNCKTISDVKEKLMLLIEKCKENDYVLLIDDLDKLYNFNSSTFDKKYIGIILYYYLDTSYKLKILATINKKNEEIINEQSITACYPYYYSIEYNENDLKLIIEDILEKYTNLIDNNLLNILKEILIIVSKENNIINSDTISNVKVIKSIIEDLFKDKNDIDINHLIYCIRINRYIKEDIKNIIINELNKLKNNYTEENIKKLIKELN